MADYHSPTVVTPDLPKADMTALEYLILSLAFDCELSGEDYVYFHSWCGPSDIVSIELGSLREAYDGSIDAQSAINDHIAVLLKGHDARGDSMPGDYIEIDLTEINFGWDHLLQDVVRRSTVLHEIVVTAAFTCTKMRPDGFGGSMMRITSDAIQYSSTTEMLEKMWNTPASSAVPNTDGHETRGRLEGIAASAGWDSFTLMLLVARWADEHGQTKALTEPLDRLAASEDA